MRFIYCRGGDKLAPQIAKSAGMLYGVRYDYTAYDDVYMLDVGLKPRWPTYMRKVYRYKPTFALVPDYTKHDPIALALYIQDLRNAGVKEIGVCPKFMGAIADIPQDCIVCISIPTRYAGFLPPDKDIRTGRYHLLGGDPRQQMAEVQRITSLGGTVVSMDGNKLAHKAAHGQVFDARLDAWRKTSQTTAANAQQSANNIVSYISR